MPEGLGGWERGQRVTPKDLVHYRGVPK